MAYYRRRFRRRRPFRGYMRRRRGGGGGMRSYMNMARMAYRGVQYLRGLVNAEMKKHDVAISAQSVSNTANVNHITNIAQGDTDASRDGNSIFVRSVNSRGKLRWNTSGDNQQTCKIALILDTQQIADTAPAWTDIYEAAATATTNPYSHLNSTTVGRFKVLWSRVYQLSAQNPAQTIIINKPMKHHVRYNGTASTDQQKGALYIVNISTQETANFPLLDLETRVSFHDN